MNALLRNEREAAVALEDEALRRERELADMAAADMEPWGHFTEADEQQQGVAWPMPVLIAVVCMVAAGAVWLR